MAEDKKIKITATQVEPECQESPLMEGDAVFDEVLIKGAWNRTLPGKLHDMFSDWSSSDYDIADIIAEENADAADTVRQIKDLLGLKNGEGSDQLIIWKAASKAYSEAGRGHDDTSPVLTAMTGQKYERDTIRGCSQSDWADLYHPADWTDKQVDEFAACYFNTGTEYMVSEEDSDDLYSFYTTEYEETEVKKQIASDYGISPDNVALKIFEGYKKTPVYRTV